MESKNSNEKNFYRINSSLSKIYFANDATFLPVPPDLFTLWNWSNSKTWCNKRIGHDRYSNTKMSAASSRWIRSSTWKMAFEKKIIFEAFFYCFFLLNPVRLKIFKNTNSNYYYLRRFNYNEKMVFNHFDVYTHFIISCL